MGFMTEEVLVNIAWKQRGVTPNEGAFLAQILLSLLESDDERIAQAAEDALMFPLKVAR